MSAIWGVVTLDEEREIPKKAKAIFEATYQEKCKLDRLESVFDTDAYIGCGIQYITKESKREQLPIVDKERGIIFVADCILDNRKSIIERLVSYGEDAKRLQEEPDGRLMYESYLYMGKDCVKTFRGLFSIAIWDWKRHVLSLLSDQVSARCLYYIKKGHLVAFSTQMKPLLELFPGLEENKNYYMY